MNRKLYVGNLPYSASEDDLQGLFGEVGAVESVSVMRDRETGRARGFAFVEMANDEAAQKAISQLHGHALEGRPLVVNEARPKPEGGGPPFQRGAGGSRAGGDMGGRREPRW